MSRDTNVILCAMNPRQAKMDTSAYNEAVAEARRQALGESGISRNAIGTTASHVVTCAHCSVAHCSVYVVRS